MEMVHMACPCVGDLSPGPPELLHSIPDTLKPLLELCQSIRVEHQYKSAVECKEKDELTVRINSISTPKQDKPEQPHHAKPIGEGEEPCLKTKCEEDTDSVAPSHKGDKTTEIRNEVIESVEHCHLIKTNTLTPLHEKHKSGMDPIQGPSNENMISFPTKFVSPMRIKSETSPRYLQAIGNSLRNIPNGIDMRNILQNEILKGTPDKVSTCHLASENLTEFPGN